MDRMTEETSTVDGSALAAEVVRRLTELGLTIATAESSTGGLAGYLLVTVPGASRVFAGGTAAYGLEAKQRWLGVPDETIALHGSVHEATALAMARGAREALGVDLAVAETGIAGSSDNPDRPGGLWYIALVGPGSAERVERHLFEGDRIERLHAAAHRMLALLLNHLHGHLDGVPDDSR